MDDPNITMEEYIRLEEEKAQRHGRTFNWQTATFGKVENYEDEDDCFINFKAEFPAIVFDNTLASDITLPCEPTVSPLNENKIDFRISLDESDDEDYTIRKMIMIKKNMPSSPKPTVDYLDDLDSFNDFENEFPAIVYNDGLTSKPDLKIEPSISSERIDKFETSLSEYDKEEQNDLHFSDSFPPDIFFSNDPKMTEDSNDNIGITPLSEYKAIKKPNELPRKNHDKTNKILNEKIFIIMLGANMVSWNYFNWMPLQLIKNLYMPFGIPFDPKRYYKDGAHTRILRWPRTIWDRSVNRVHILDFEGLTPEMRQDLAVRLRMVYTGEDGQQLGGVRRRMTWRQFILPLGLHTEQEMAQARFGVYWTQSKRIVPNKGDLRDYWIDISSDRDFLGPAPSYVHIRDPVRRLCHRMIACTISGRGQGPEKGRKSEARLSEGYFIGRLTEHFGLLARLNICRRFGDTWAWVAPGPERQPVAAADALEADEDAPDAAEGAHADLAPAQAPPPPPPAPQPRTMSQRIERVEEEMCDLRHDVLGLRGVVESFTTEQSRVSTWLISCMTQLIYASGHTYQAFDSTLFGSSWMPYQRRVRPRTGGAITLAAPHADDQPDP
ncbi:hypothetical protein Tco_0047189 [Tanacetum coccineum]